MAALALVMIKPAAGFLLMLTAWYLQLVKNIREAAVGFHMCKLLLKVNIMYLQSIVSLIKYKQYENTVDTMKPILTSQGLIDHMKDKGITFNIVSEDAAKEFLERHNYYLKFASYRENYKKHTEGPRIGQYINLDFAYLKELSTIDMHLRYIILEMCLDIEHFLKVALLNSIANNTKEDGYQIVQDFLDRSKKDDKGNPKVLLKIQSHNSEYCKGLINTYNPQFPVWAFVELISLGDLAFFAIFTIRDVELK